MAKGFSNRVVADTLSISVKAVERHVTSIFRKLGNIDPKRFDRRVAAVISYVDAFGTPTNLDE
jgi:DNA-binding NarL/FixJ family response regulator